MNGKERKGESWKRRDWNLIGNCRRERISAQNDKKNGLSQE